TVLVLRRRGRRVVSVLGALAATAAAVTALTSAGNGPEVAARLLGSEADSTSTSAWPFVTAVACAVAAGAFVVAFLQVGRWPEMSSRYDAPGGRHEHTGDAEGKIGRASCR